MTGRTCIARFGKLEQKVHEFKAYLGYIVKICLKSKIRDSEMGQRVRMLGAKCSSLSVQYLGGGGNVEKRENWFLPVDF